MVTKPWHERFAIARELFLEYRPHLMDIVVQSGQTKATHGTHLVSKHLRSQSGENVFVVLHVHSEDEVARTLQKELLTLIRETLLETEGELTVRLDGSLKEINGLIKGMALSKSIEDFHALIGVLSPDQTLHVSHAGRAEAYVVRGGVATQITEYSKGKPSPTFVHIASGALEPRDTVIFSTQRLLRTVTPAQLVQIIGRDRTALDELTHTLDTDHEHASILLLSIPGAALAVETPPKRGERSGRGERIVSSPSKAKAAVGGTFDALIKRTKGAWEKVSDGVKVNDWRGKMQDLLSDLKDPKRKVKANLLIIASVFGIFLVVWFGVHLTIFSERSKNRAEMQSSMDTITELLKKAENSRLMGDKDAANAILLKAEEETQKILNGENTTYRMQAADLDSQIRTKREEVNNVIRQTPSNLVNLASRKANSKAVAMIGYPGEKFTIFDDHDRFAAVHNTIEEPRTVTESEDRIVHAADFPRYQTSVVQTSGNTLIELSADATTPMKTEDPAGWMVGQDLESYLRYLYVLVPSRNQIFKYERLSNRYGMPVEYNVNADLQDALDMAIDGSVYVLKTGGKVLKLLRGELQPFSIRLLPPDALNNTTKIFKVEGGNLYFLDPIGRRVVVVEEGEPAGEASYVRQYVLAGDELTDLVDLYVDPDQKQLYVLDEKRLYNIELKEGR